MFNCIHSARHGIILRDHKRNTWIRHQTGVNDIIDVIKKGIHGWAGHIARFKNNRWTKRVTKWTPREWTRWQGRPKTRQPYPPPGYYVDIQRPASVETVQGGVSPYGVKETLVVNVFTGKIICCFFRICAFQCLILFDMITAIYLLGREKIRGWFSV